MFWLAWLLKLCASASIRLAGARTVKSNSSLNDVRWFTLAKEWPAWVLVSILSEPRLKTVAEAGAAPAISIAARATKAVRVIIKRCLHVTVYPPPGGLSNCLKRVIEYREFDRTRLGTSPP